MISVLVSKSDNYPIKSPKIKKVLRDFFNKNGIVSDAEVSVSIVNEKKMKEISNKFLKDNKVHNVLSFTSEETKGSFVYPPDKIYLGDIVLCYPMIVKESQMEGKLIEDKAMELLLHGGEHLLGRHHE
jgi:probable rRNA maturation factor